jgi:hypothetical protein
MGEAVRTYASPAATWAIVVIASGLALFMAMAALAANHFQIREHRRMRKLGIWPAPAAALDTDIDAGITNPWPPLSEALFDAAGAQPPAATEAAAWTQAGYTAAGHDFPAEIPAQRQEPAGQPAAARQAAVAHAGAPAAEPPTVPIPAQRAPGTGAMRDVAAGRHGPDGTPPGEMPTSPDLLAQEAPGRQAMPMPTPTQRTGESDRAERSFAGPAPQEDDEDEQ